MTVLFAKGDEDADSRLENLIAKHSAPKTLTVVSTDRRIRQAALRRKARSVTSDEFWSQLESRRTARSVSPDRRPLPEAERERQQGPGPAQSAFWMEVFADVAASPEARQVFEPSDAMLTDEEIRRIAEEVRREP
jgi:hypothetical protein